MTCAREKTKKPKKLARMNEGEIRGLWKSFRNVIRSHNFIHLLSSLAVLLARKKKHIGNVSVKRSLIFYDFFFAYCFTTLTRRRNTKTRNIVRHNGKWHVIRQRGTIEAFDVYISIYVFFYIYLKELREKKEILKRKRFFCKSQSD